IKRLLLRRGARNYRDGIDMYLQEKILKRAAAARAQGGDALRKALADTGTYSAEWADISGLLVAGTRLQALVRSIADGKITDAGAFHRAMAEAAAAYEADEWAWVRRTWGTRTGKAIDQLAAADLDAMQQEYDKARSTFIKKVLADAEKEFDEVARFGYGADGDEAARAADFAAVRGSFDGNSFVKGMKKKLADLG
ncbi:MAG: hypothetical protein ABIL09_16790, partial [Gemmatimonadota bacterium]